MRAFLEIIFAGPWQFAGGILLLMLSAAVFLASVNAIGNVWRIQLRARTIRLRGYPPPHCDVDGDLSPAAKMGYSEHAPAAREGLTEGPMKKGGVNDPPIGPRPPLPPPQRPPRPEPPPAPPAPTITPRPRTFPTLRPGTPPCE